MIWASSLWPDLWKTSSGCARHCAVSFPGPDLGFKEFAAADAAIKTLAPHDADFDFGHIQPTCMAWSVVKLKAS
jgi:hypothetical protein